MAHQLLNMMTIIICDETALSGSACVRHRQRAIARHYRPRWRCDAQSENQYSATMWVSRMCAAYVCAWDWFY